MNTVLRNRLAKHLQWIGCVLAITACGDDDGGVMDAAVADGGGMMDGGASDAGPDAPTSGETLTVSIEAEATITEGLSTEGDDAIMDGWSVTFGKYIVAIGDIDLHEATDETMTAADESLFTYDLVQTPAAGDPLWTIDGLSVGRWQFSYVQAHASEATRNANVTEADHMRMVDNECTYLVEGTLARDDGRSCVPRTDDVPAGMTPDDDGCYANTSITFSFCADAETSFGPCEVDEMEGVAITAGANNASVTIHGDHIFFNGFPEGDEGGVMRLAQWLADCDLNLDGQVTQEELASIAIDDLAEIDARYELGGAPRLEDDEPLDDMWAYLRAQLKTQGHFLGEGECPVDGVEHDH